MSATGSGTAPATDATAGGINWPRFDELCEAREITGETARAAVFGVDRTTVYRWRHGQQSPRFTAIQHAARQLSVPIGELTA